MRRFGFCFLVLALAGALAQVRPVWDSAKAYREGTPTRERLSINGVWRWQAAEKTADRVPESGWGYLRIPESWPANARNVAAWYQREITAPAEWSGRRIVISAEYINSYAAVYLDGAKVGEMRFPAGEVDLTAVVKPGRTHLLSMLVVAMPLKAVMLSHSDTAAAKEVEGRVERKGLCGDVWLASVPSGPRVIDLKVETSVRLWQLSVGASLTGLDAGTRYMLRARITDGSRHVREFRSSPFAGAARSAMVESWHPEKLWDTITPQNQYDLSVSLLDAGGRELDTALPVRFGFREFWIDGRDFYLNGTRIYLSAIPLDNAQGSSVMASYEATRATLQRFKSFGINFVYTHNYGCEPGTHLSFEEVLRAADDEGMLLAFSQPHFNSYEWTAPDADVNNGYRQHAQFYVHVAQNHASVVAYATSHNATGYSEDMNPDMIDGRQVRRDTWGARNTARALRAEAIIKQLDSSRVVYHHSSGDLGSMHTVNFYGNWIPIQEMSDWFEHWSTAGVKPIFTCEYSVPFLWDWAMYRGWYKGKREFGSAVVPWEFSIAEWDAQFLGDRAYRISDAEKVNLRWEADQFRKGRVWQRWDYPQSLNSQVFDDRFTVVAEYLTANWRAFRTWGMSANSPWDYGSYWKHKGAREGELKLDIDWDKLQRPGPRPVYLNEDEARAQLAFHATDWEPTAAAEALYRNNRPLLAYIGGKAAAVTSQDHNFLPGETVEKQLIVINNSRVPVAAECSWRLGLPFAVVGAAKISLPTGEQQRIPLRFALPKELAAGRYELRATVKFATGETQEDTFAIDVLPRAAAVASAAKIALYDPKGDTAKLLDGLGVRWQRVEAGSNLSTFDVLVVGKGALALEGPAPDIARVHEGLKVVVFEQTGEVLEKRFGFRVAEYGLRQVFRRVPDHPVLAGIGDDNLRDWRGDATTLPPRLDYKEGAQFNLAPTVEWAGIPVTRVWRNGNRGSVASALIEKPARGDFLPILDGGYSLQYSPLLEYREGAGMVLFCQVDVSGRTEGDPAADRMARNIVRYVSGWKAAPRRSVVYSGEDAGLQFLKSAGIAAAPYSGAVTDQQVLVVGPGGGSNLPKAGAHVLAIGLDVPEATIVSEHIATYFEPFGAGSVFAGISPADVFNRDPRKVPLLQAGTGVVGDGVLAEIKGVVYSQLVPWQFDYSGEKMNVKRTFRRVACLTSRLLGNLGVASDTPLLARFSKPPAGGEKRWLDGFYLDTPEEWDDPYRFFRW